MLAIRETWKKCVEWQDVLIKMTPLLFVLMSSSGVSLCYALHSVKTEQQTQPHGLLH